MEYSTNRQFKLKNLMLASSLCDYSVTHKLVSRTKIIPWRAADQAVRQAHERTKGKIFKNFPSFTDYIYEINNSEEDSAKDLDVVMPMYNLIENSDNYTKALRGLWQYYRDEQNAFLTDSKSFICKMKITGCTINNDTTKGVKKW